MKLLTATLVAGMTAATPAQQVVISMCAPRPEALKQHMALGYENVGVKLTRDDIILEKWRNREGKVFVTTTSPDGKVTCFLKALPDEPEI